MSIAGGERQIAIGRRISIRSTKILARLLLHHDRAL